MLHLWFGFCVSAAPPRLGNNMLPGAILTIAESGVTGMQTLCSDVVVPTNFIRVMHDSRSRLLTANHSLPLASMFYKVSFPPHATCQMSAASTEGLGGRLVIRHLLRTEHQ